MAKNRPSKITTEEKLSLETLSEGLRSRISFEQSAVDRIADFLTSAFGTVFFLVLNALFFVTWIALNLGLLGFEPFDPYPFGFLTMVVSLEAIALSIIVLISQNRASRIADIRQQIDFEIDVRSEEEITKILNMLDEVHDHMGLNPEDDAELKRMKQVTNLHHLQKEIEDRNK